MALLLPFDCRMKKGFLLTAIALSGYWMGLQAQTAKTIGSQRQLFTDKWFVDSMVNCRLVLHEPVDRGAVIQFNEGLLKEGTQCNYATVIRRDSLFQLYYRAGYSGIDDYSFQVTSYAESRDGIHWEKPILGLHEVNGSKKNNIILTNENRDHVVHNFSPFYDGRPGVPAEQRYKGLGGLRHGLFAYVSADGRKWTRLQEKPVLTGSMFDSQNVTFWSESEQVYVCYFREWTKGSYEGYRTVARSTSPDFINWTPKQMIRFGNTPEEHIYISQTAPYYRAPQIYLSTAARLVTDRIVLPAGEAERLGVEPIYRRGGIDGISDVVLMTTRGGDSMDRSFMGSMLRPGIGYRNWISRSNFPALNIVETGPDELSMYVVQEYAQPGNHLRRYTWRTDGLASVQAPYEGGEFFTPFFTFTGAQLHLNYTTSAAGSIRVEVQDENGNPIKYFRAQDCNPLIGNETGRRVYWERFPQLSELQGKTIRLRFIMQDADLYSLKFEP
jgi:hypothetical protein